MGIGTIPFNLSSWSLSFSAPRSTKSERPLPGQRERRLLCSPFRVTPLFDGSWARQAEEISNAEVGRRLDAWLSRLSTFVEADARTEDEQLRLGHLLKVLTQRIARFSPMLRCGRISSHQQ